jgi:hypothetical protein
MAQMVYPWVSAEGIVADQNHAQKHVAQARVISGSPD